MSSPSDAEDLERRLEAAGFDPDDRGGERLHVADARAVAASPIALAYEDGTRFDGAYISVLLRDGGVIDIKVPLHHVEIVPQGTVLDTIAVAQEHVDEAP